MGSLPCLTASAVVSPNCLPYGCRIAALLEWLRWRHPSFARMYRHTHFLHTAYTQLQRIVSWDKRDTCIMPECQEDLFPFNGSPVPCHTCISSHADKAQLLPPQISARLLQLGQHPSCATEVLDHQPLLGVMARLLDQIASTHVFGDHGSKGRPRGHLTMSLIHDMEQHQRLSSSSKHSWYQFLQLLYGAVWSCMAQSWLGSL